MLLPGLLLVLGALSLSSAQAPPADTKRAPASERGGPHDDGESELGLAMESLKADLRKLGGFLKAGDKQAEALAVIANMQRGVLDAKLLPPSNLSEIAEGERPAHVLLYRKEMAMLLQEFAALEIDVIEGANAAALERMKGKLAEMRDAGHDKFQPKDG